MKNLQIKSAKKKQLKTKRIIEHLFIMCKQGQTVGYDQNFNERKGRETDQIH